MAFASNDPGQAMHQGLFERIMIKHCRKNKAAKHRLLAGDVFCFPAHAVPNGINRLNDLRFAGLAHCNFSSRPHL
jgi:hypothetical protein